MKVTSRRKSPAQEQHPSLGTSVLMKTVSDRLNPEFPIPDCSPRTLQHAHSQVQTLWVSRNWLQFSQIGSETYLETKVTKVLEPRSSRRQFPVPDCSTRTLQHTHAHWLCRLSSASHQGYPFPVPDSVSFLSLPLLTFLFTGSCLKLRLHLNPKQGTKKKSLLAPQQKKAFFVTTQMRHYEFNPKH